MEIFFSCVLIFAKFSLPIHTYFYLEILLPLKKKKRNLIIGVVLFYILYLMAACVTNIIFYWQLTSEISAIYQIGVNCVYEGRFFLWLPTRYQNEKVLFLCKN